MAKKYKGYRFDAGTLREIELLKKNRNIENETLLLETLISEAVEKINKKKNEGLTAIDVINLFSENDIHFTNKEGRFFINDRIFDPVAAESFIRSRLASFEIHYTMGRFEFEAFAKNVTKEIIEHVSPGLTEKYITAKDNK